MSKTDEIILVYKGKLPEHINGVPARDLTADDIQQVAQLWGISPTETEGLLLKNKLYGQAPKPTKKAAEAATEILEDKE